MSAASLTRSRLLITATILCVAILLGLPSAYNFISGPKYPVVPSGLIVADVASGDEPASARRTRPKAESQPVARDHRHDTSLGNLASMSYQTLDERIADAIHREDHEQQPDVEDLVAYLLQDPYYGDFAGYGTGWLTGTTGGAGGTRSGAAFGGGGVGGGGVLASPGGGGTDAPGNGGTGLSNVNEIPGPMGQPSSGGGVVFTPKIDGGELVVSPEIELPWTDTPKTFGPPTNQIDPAAVPKAPTSVPEPATLALTGLGLCGVIAKARARRRRSQ